jgi:predicted alpha/beta hydrolase family esterase
MENRQQIIHIHGGESWKSYEDYVKYLEKVEISIDFNQKQQKRWYKFDSYNSVLNSEKYEIIIPMMPSKYNAHYNEWKIWFEKIFPFLNDGVILIGHSLGGVFLAKYLSENNFKFKIKQIHLVAPVYNMNGEVGDFILNTFPGKFMDNVNEVHIYHSADDSVVPISESEKYIEKIPTAKFHRFTDRGHFLDETFPELFDIIKKSY